MKNFAKIFKIALSSVLVVTLFFTSYLFPVATGVTESGEYVVGEETDETEETLTEEEEKTAEEVRSYLNGCFSVDFKYGTEFHCMSGMTTISMDELTCILKIEGTVEKAEFSDASLLRVYEEEGEFYLESLKEFDTTESLKLTMTDGKVIDIEVTDAQGTWVGEGTKDSPYIISKWQDLNLIRTLMMTPSSTNDNDNDYDSAFSFKGIYFKQVCDIDMSGFYDYQEGEKRERSWCTMTEELNRRSENYCFSGVYDGNGYSIGRIQNGQYVAETGIDVPFSASNGYDGTSISTFKDYVDRTAFTFELTKDISQVSVAFWGSSSIKFNIGGVSFFKTEAERDAYLYGSEDVSITNLTYTRDSAGIDVTMSSMMFYAEELCTEGSVAKSGEGTLSATEHTNNAADSDEQKYYNIVMSGVSSVAGSSWVVLTLPQTVSEEYKYGVININAVGGNATMAVYTHNNERLVADRQILDTDPKKLQQLSILGLFGKVNGVVKNLTVCGNIEGITDAGGIICGELAEGGRIENCKTYGSVSGYAYYSWVTNKLDRTPKMGGVTGTIAGGTVWQCENYADVTATRGDGFTTYSTDNDLIYEDEMAMYVGGITGLSYCSGVMGGTEEKSVINYGTVRASMASRVGGIAGEWRGMAYWCRNRGAMIFNNSICCAGVIACMSTYTSKDSYEDKDSGSRYTDHTELVNGRDETGGSITDNNSWSVLYIIAYFDGGCVAYGLGNNASPCKYKNTYYRASDYIGVAESLESTTHTITYAKMTTYSSSFSESNYSGTESTQTCKETEVCTIGRPIEADTAQKKFQYWYCKHENGVTLTSDSQDRRLCFYEGDQIYLTFDMTLLPVWYISYQIHYVIHGSVYSAASYIVNGTTNLSAWAIEKQVTTANSQRTEVVDTSSYITILNGDSLIYDGGATFAYWCTNPYGYNSDDDPNYACYTSGQTIKYTDFATEYADRDLVLYAIPVVEFTVKISDDLIKEYYKQYDDKNIYMDVAFISMEDNQSIVNAGVTYTKGTGLSDSNSNCEVAQASDNHYHITAKNLYDNTKDTVTPFEITFKGVPYKSGASVTLCSTSSFTGKKTFDNKTIFVKYDGAVLAKEAAYRMETLSESQVKTTSDDKCWIFDVADTGNTDGGGIGIYAVCGIGFALILAGAVVLFKLKRKAQ